MRLLMKAIFRNIILSFTILLICLVFINVLFINKELEINDFDSKLVAFNIITSLALISSSLTLCRYNLTIDCTTAILVLFTVFLFFNYFIKVPLYNNFLSAVGLITLLFVTIKNLLLVSNKKSNMLFLFTGTLLFTGVFENISGVLQLFQLVEKRSMYISGTFNNSGVFAIYISACICFSFGYYLFDNKSNKWIRILCILTLLSGIIILPSTFARAAWLGVLGSV